ncbi:MAG TPA: hypothetical protein VGJ70_02705, partial [Solirubrobacteraceae bacterium]
MRLEYQMKRLGDVRRGALLARTLAERARWPRDRLERHQREAVDAIARHAAARSPLWHERLAAHLGPRPVELSALPTLDKAALMERFDELVADPRLRRDALLAHLDALGGDDLYLGEHRVMATSGS